MAVEEVKRLTAVRLSDVTRARMGEKNGRIEKLQKDVVETSLKKEGYGSNNNSILFGRKERAEMAEKLPMIFEELIVEG